MLDENPILSKLEELAEDDSYFAELLFCLKQLMIHSQLEDTDLTQTLYDMQSRESRESKESKEVVYKKIHGKLKKNRNYKNKAVIR